MNTTEQNGKEPGQDFHQIDQDRLDDNDDFRGTFKGEKSVATKQVVPPTIKAATKLLGEARDQAGWVRSELNQLRIEEIKQKLAGEWHQTSPATQFASYPCGYLLADNKFYFLKSSSDGETGVKIFAATPELVIAFRSLCGN